MELTRVSELSVCDKCNEYKHAQVPHVCLRWKCPHCHYNGHDVQGAIKHVCHGKVARLSPELTTQALQLLLNKIDDLVIEKLSKEVVDLRCRVASMEKILVDHNIINEKVFQDEAKRSAA